jgi:Tfp pilus assembly protein PilO
LSLIILINIFLIIPASTSIKQNQKLLTEKIERYTSQEKKISTLQSIQGKSEEQTSQLEKINSLWPDEKQVSNFIVDLENMANIENITLRNITISESANSKNKKDSEIQFSFDTKTSFNQILNIIKNLEKFSRFNTIKQLGFANDSEGLISLKVTGSIYYGN